MTENECKATLKTSFQWLTAAFLLWAIPVIYTCLYFSHLLYFYQPIGCPLYLFLRVYILFALLMFFKYLTLSFFPDASSSLDEVRKIFTSISFFHALIIASIVIYNVLFRELNYVLGFTRVNAWMSFLSMLAGILSSLLYILRHDYIAYWFDPPFGRISWVCQNTPRLLVVSLVVSVSSVVLGNFIWLFLRYEIGGTEYWTYVFIITFLDSLLTTMMQNFLAKPSFLDDLNYLGEELAVIGLLTKDIEVHFQCLQDLNRASNSRKMAIMDYKSNQWTIVLELCLEYINKVPKHILNYSALKVREKGMVYQRTANEHPVVAQVLTWLYFVFNEPFEIKFRNQLFKNFTMAALSANVIAKFVTAPGLASIVIKDNTLTSIIQSLADSLIELEKYQKVDPCISSAKFTITLMSNLKAIKEVYRDYISSLSLNTETIELLFSRVN